MLMLGGNPLRYVDPFGLSEQTPWATDISTAEADSGNSGLVYREVALTCKVTCNDGSKHDYRKIFSSWDSPSGANGELRNALITSKDFRRNTDFNDSGVAYRMGICPAP